MKKIAFDICKFVFAAVYVFTYVNQQYSTLLVIAVVLFSLLISIFEGGKMQSSNMQKIYIYVYVLVNYDLMLILHTHIHSTVYGTHS